MKSSSDSSELRHGLGENGAARLSLRDWRTGLSYLVCLVFFVSLSITQYFSVGGLTAEIDELGAALAILSLWILWESPASARVPNHRGGWWITLAFSGLAIWCGVVWLLAGNWQDRMGILQSWVLCALLAYVLLVRARLNWEEIAFAFALASIPNSALAVYQHFSGIGYGYKDLVGWIQGSAGGPKPVIGFFSFSNDMAAYLLWPFVISVGLAFQGPTIRRILSGLCALLAALALFWTFSRTAILTAGVALVLCAIISLARNRRAALLGLGVAALVAALAAAAVLARHTFMTLSSGRPVVWLEALQMIRSDRFFLAIGYLDAFKGSAVSPFWVPHNIYLMLWMQFGVLGVVFLLGLLSQVIWLGWTGYREVRSRPLLLASWSVLLAFFFIEGMATNDLLEPYSLLTFAVGICLLVGLAEQVPQLRKG
jgi:hypothetical protein